MEKITEEAKFERQQEIMSERIELIAELITKGMLKAAKIEINSLKKYLDFEYRNAKNTKNSI